VISTIIDLGKLAFSFITKREDRLLTESTGRVAVAAEAMKSLSEERKQRAKLLEQFSMSPLLQWPLFITYTSISVYTAAVVLASMNPDLWTIEKLPPQTVELFIKPAVYALFGGGAATGTVLAIIKAIRK